MKRSWHDIRIMIITGIIAVLTLLSGCLLDSDAYLFFLIIVILGIIYLSIFYMVNCSRWENSEVFDFIKFRKNSALLDIYVKNMNTGKIHKVGSNPSDSLWVDRLGIVHYNNFQDENTYEFIPSYNVKEVAK